MQKIKNNWLAIVCALGFSIIVVSPHLIYLSNVRENFDGVHKAFSDDEVYYQARIAEVVRGEYSIGNPYIREHKDDLFIHPPLAEWVMAGAVFITGLSVPAATMLGDIIFVFLNFILVYLLFKIITQKPKLSVLFTSVFFLFFISTFGRPISPQVTAPFLFIGLILIYLIYKDDLNWGKNNGKLNSLLGLIVGICFFISPYYWTTLVTIYFLAVLGRDVIRRRFKDLRKNIFSFAITFLPLLGLYAHFVFRASGLAGYEDTMSRFGLFASHWPGSYTSIALGALAGLVLWLSRKKLSLNDLWFAGCLIGSIFLLNWQNVITGQVLQFSSHYLMVTILFALISLAIIYKIDNKKVGIAFVMSFILFVQFGEIKGFWNSVTQDQSIETGQYKSDVFEWLNKNTEPDSVVYTLGGDYDFLLPIYTHNKVYYNFYANLFVMTDEEVENRWLLQNIFNPEVGEQYILSKQRDFWGNRYIDSYYSSENRKKIISSITGQEYIKSVQVDIGLISELKNRFDLFKQAGIRESLDTYRFDRILLTRDYPHYEYAKSTLEKEGFKQEVVLGDTIIYK